ncbi:MAG: hypothetical protein ABR589_09780 [Chthoniobacterales bacterium]
MHTVPAEIDEHGNVRLLEKVHGTAKRRAFVTILDDSEGVSETALLSEAALAEDWERPEEDKAWSYLRPAQ